MGTPEFAVPCLERLYADGHEVLLAVTQADKPKGRGYTLTPPPVKSCALAHGTPVAQPAKVKNNPGFFEQLAACRPDAAVVVAYGKILPQEVLDIPRFGCVNVHASLLPRYRGAAPIQWAVLNGETESGVTTMRMDAGLDTGEMLVRRRVGVPPDMTSGELHGVLSREGADALSETLRRLEAGTLVPERQDDALSCYAPMLSRDLSPVDWNRPAGQLKNQVRGLNPWPSALTRLEGKALKIHRAEIGPAVSAAPGTVVSTDPLTVACGEETSLVLREVQPEGGRRMDAADFVRGRTIKPGLTLDN